MIGGIKLFYSILSFLFFRWLTAILVNSLNQSMIQCFPFILCYAKAKVEEDKESTPRTSFLPNSNCFPFYPID